MVAEVATGGATRVYVPRGPAVVTLALAIVAGACAVLGATQPVSWLVPLAGYVMGCIGTVAGASVHRSLENKRRSNPRFQLQPFLGRLAHGAMVAGLVAGLMCAFLVATELAK